MAIQHDVLSGCIDVLDWKPNGIRQLIGWREICQLIRTPYNQAHLLDSVDISIKPNSVDFLVTIVSSVVHKSV